MTDYTENAFLTIHYKDKRRKLETWRVYANDGQVHIFDGSAWRTDYTLTTDERQQIRTKLESCGVFDADNLSGAGYYDTALLVWTWDLPDGVSGTLKNFAHPAEKHPAMDCVMDFLLDLEDTHLDIDTDT